MDLPKSIGIKLYDDTFVPVLNSDEQKSRKLSLTTIDDGQKKAVVSLYEGTSDKCKNNTFLGKLVIPINRETKKGQPAIEVHLRNDESGMLFAKAWDTDSHEECSIEIKHKGSSKRIYPETLSDIEIENLKGTENYYDENSEFQSFNEENEKPSIVKNIIIMAIIIFVIIALGLLSFFGATFIYKNFIKDKIANRIHNSANDNRESSSSSSSSDRSIEPRSSSSSSIVIPLSSSSSSRSSSRSSVSSSAASSSSRSEVTGVRQTGGTQHFVRRGDNLWNICKRYYGDPWYYPELFKANPQLRSPRLIMAGTKLNIPDKSTLKRWDPVRNRLAE